MQDSLDQTMQHVIALREDGKYREAVTLLQAALKEHPDAVGLYALLAHLLLLLKQNAAAAEAIAKARAIAPRHSLVRLNHARLLQRAQKHAEALQELSDAYRDNPADIEVKLVLASTLCAGNQIDKAAVLIDEVLSSRHDYAEAYATRATLNARRGDVAAAAADAETALQLKPHLDQMWAFLGLLRRKAGNRQGALDAFSKVLRLDPVNVSALLALGELERLAGRNQQALEHFSRVAQLTPHDANAWTNLGVAFLDCRRNAEAADAFHKALQISPTQAEAANNLGVLAKTSGDTEKAIAWFTQAIEAKPDFADAHSNLGACFNRTGAFDKAAAHFTRALALNPTQFEALLGFGNTMAQTGRHLEAVAGFQKAIQVNPDSADAWTNLGNVLREAGRFAEAESSHVRAIQLRPDFAEAYFNLANLLMQLDRFPAAIANYTKALELKPDYAEAHCNLGNLLVEAGRFFDAITCFEKALEIRPTYAEAQSNLGNALKDLGRIDEAEACYRKALDINPNQRAAFGNLLFTLNYHPDRSAEEIFAEYRAFDARFGKPQRDGTAAGNTTALPDGKLKIGYVAASFHSHSTRHFLEPLLANHDRTVVEVHAYAESIREDDVTNRYRSYVDRWTPTKGLSDDALAQRIREDGIHILVDITGHTTGNRLGVFARKPAPVSLHWLDFGYTTGLSAIDYYLCDAWMVPEGADALFSEKPWRLPVPAFAYRPAPGMGEVSPLPLLRNGYLTFGTLTRAVRINHRSIRVWAQILDRVANSVLVIDSSNFRESDAREVLIARFESAGISRERLVIGYHSPPWDVLRSMDIGLDCFPHNSGTTLFEHLYLGVPFITLASRPSVGRLGASILQGVGHPELIAATEADYVEKAVALAHDVQRLQKLRAGLRGRMENSPLMDERGFARHVEAAYGAMWQEFIRKENLERVKGIEPSS